MSRKRQFSIVEFFKKKGGKWEQNGVDTIECFVVRFAPVNTHPRALILGTFPFTRATSTRLNRNRNINTMLSLSLWKKRSNRSSVSDGHNGHLPSVAILCDPVVLGVTPSGMMTRTFARFDTSFTGRVEDYIIFWLLINKKKRKSYIRKQS